MDEDGGRGGVYSTLFPPTPTAEAPTLGGVTDTTEIVALESALENTPRYHLDWSTIYKGRACHSAGHPGVPKLLRGSLKMNRHWQWVELPN